MVIKYALSPYPAMDEDMVIKIYEAANDTPGAEVYIEPLAAPHTAPRTITVNGLDNVVHIVRLYTATSNVLLHEYNEEPTGDSAINLFDPIRFKIGDGGAITPAANTKDYTDPLLVGLTAEDLEVFRNSYGILFLEIHYTLDGATGKMSLVDPDRFNDSEEFVIKRKPQINTPIHDSVVGKWFAGFVDVVVNTSYIPGHLRRLIRFTSTAQYIFDTPIPIGYAFCFTNNGSGTGTVKFNNAPLLVPGGTTTDTMTIPQNAYGCFSFDGTNWNVVYYVLPAPAPSGGPATEHILATGIYLVGDVPSGDPIYTIQHNLAIVGDYGVLFSIRSNSLATSWKDNLLCGTWFHDLNDKPNKFKITLQEIQSETQNISICWAIIKLS